VTSALFVNAMPAGWSDGDSSSLRFCWSSDGVFQGQPAEDGGVTDEPFPSEIMPASNFSGVALGGAALLSDATSLINPDGASISLYAIRAIRLQKYQQADTPCSTLFAPSSKVLSPNTDYFDLGTVSIQPGATNVIVVDGCIGGGLSLTATTASCGPSWNSDTTAGNLSVRSFTLASSSGGDGGFPLVQAAQLSPGFVDLIPEGGTATISLAALATDGGSGTDIVKTIGQVSGEGQVFPNSAVLLPVSGGLASYADMGLRLDVSGADAGTRSLFLTLAQIQELADPTADPRVFYGAAGTYLIGVVGDPRGVPPFTTTPEGGTYDGTGLHFVFAQARP
jgi:hypothetical protein